MILGAKTAPDNSGSLESRKTTPIQAVMRARAMEVVLAGCQKFLIKATNISIFEPFKASCQGPEAVRALGKRDQTSPSDERRVLQNILN